MNMEDIASKISVIFGI